MPLPLEAMPGGAQSQGPFWAMRAALSPRASLFPPKSIPQGSGGGPSISLIGPLPAAGVSNLRLEIQAPLLLPIQEHPEGLPGPL